ncbi:hypothetical protein IC762_17615 [Bradyrhizobium genosp. L]|uniref:hypothetical protein n=1 Tax=Bradyrhizobium genosp. L TaxID=83637 RepID=UPI0018A260F4|nr:hypothetical protein [Bradyrhizobium genosp. L]QPF81644.1 hypothetical protein IC762_17615 [Bradyrhizobium genosp. L]
MTRPDPIPKIVDLMPPDPSALPRYSPGFLVAMALLTTELVKRPISEESIPVTTILDMFEYGGWKLEPMTREDFEKAMRKRAGRSI